MTLLIRITVAGRPTQTVRLDRGNHKLAAERGARFELVDEATGRAPGDARLVRDGETLRITTADTGVSVDISGFYATDAGASLSLPGAAVPMVTAETALAASAGEAGGSGLLLGVLGGLAVVGGGIALASGGSGSSAPTPAPAPRDTTPPAAPTGLALAAVDDSGVSNSDRITSQTNALTITGAAEAGSRVEVLNGTTVLATVTADASGNWTADITLPVGVAAVTARATDAAGNASPASAALAITVDTAAPAAPVVVALAAADDSGASSSDRITSQTSGLTVTGTAEAGARVELFNGATALGSTTADASGNWSADITLPVGVAAVTARATDAAGNASPASAALAITVDTAAPVAPSVPIVSGGFLNASEAASSTTATLSGLEAGASGGLTLIGTEAANPANAFSATVPVAADGSFTLSPAALQGFADGTLTLSARQTDVAGNAGPAATNTFVLDRVAPTLVISGSAPTLLFGQTATISFTFSEAPQGFSVEDIVATGGTISAFAVDPANPRFFSATLTPTASASGPITISVAGAGYSDTAGNIGSASSALTIAYDVGSAGAAVDGYIANALVFRDVDNDGTWDREAFTDANDDGLWTAGEAFVDANSDGQFTAEAFTRTDSAGNFANLTGSGRIVLAPLFDRSGNVLTRDISTGGEFTKSLAAPDGATVVTPLTTLVAALAGANASAAEIAAAEVRVKAALGIDAAVDLGSFDPIAIASGGGDEAALAQAVAVQRAAVQVANVLAVVATAATSAGGFATDAEASQAAANTLATQFSGGSVDLTNSATIGAIIAGVATTGNPAAAAEIGKQADSIATALASVNEAVASAGEGAGSGAALAQIVAVQIVAQVTLAGQVETAIGGGTPIVTGDYSGAALATQVDTAAAQVQVVVPVAPAAGLGAPDRPVVDDGTRVSATELADGINVTVGLGGTSGAAAGDTLALTLDGAGIVSKLLETADIAAGSVSFAIASADLGTDGTRLLVANFIAASGTPGADSLPVVLSIDTGAAAPVLPAIADINSLGAATGRGLALGGIEIGASVALTLSGKDALAPTEDLALAVPRVDNVPTLTPELLARFADGTLGLSAVQTDALGNVSSAASTSFIIDRVAPTSPLVGAVSGGTINAAEAAAGVNFTLGGLDPAATTSVSIVNTDGARTTLFANPDGSYTLDPALIASLGQGVATVIATQADAVGNVSAADARSVQIATVLPAAPTGLDLDAADDDGVSNTDNATRQTQDLTISGNAPALASIELRVGAVVIATTTADGSGRFSTDITLPIGVTSITASATDAAGNVSAGSAPLEIRVLSPLPTATLSSPQLADAVLDVSEIVAGLKATGLDPALPATATVTGTRNGSAVTLNLVADILDPAFGIDGRATIDTSGIFSRAATALADGRVLVAAYTGFSNVPVDSRISLLMVRADGSLDPGFGNGGRATVELFTGISGESARNVVALSDGFAVVGSSGAGSSFSIARVDANGAPVTGFGNNGVVNMQGQFALNVTEAPSGKLIVTGNSPGNPSSAAMRLNADGSLDTSFGTAGVLRVSGTSRVVGAAFAPDGKLVLISGNGSNLVVTRYSADGVVDTSFGSNGRLDLPRGASLVQPSVEDALGRILVTGSFINNDSRTTDSYVARLNPDGTLDTGFGSSGFVSLPAPASGWDRPAMSSISVGIDGKIALGGSVVSDPSAPVYRPIVMRLNADGSFDTGFDGNGIYLLPETGGNLVPVAMRPDGSVITVVSTNGEIVLTSLAPAQTTEPDSWRLTLDDHLSQLDPGAITLAVSQSNVSGTQTATLSGVFDPQSGSANADTLFGTPGVDAIAAGGGDDRIFGRGGNDAIDGGTGYDTVSFALPPGIIFASPNAVVGSWAAVAGTGADAGFGLVQLVNDTSVINYYRFNREADGSVRVEGVGPNAAAGTSVLRNVEIINFIPEFTTTPVASAAFALDARPQLSGLLWFDQVVNGSVDNDIIDLPTLYPNPGLGSSFRVFASTGNDSVVGSAFADTIEGDDGSDSIDGGAGIDIATFTLQPGMVGTLRAEQGTGADAGAVILRRFIDGVVGDAVYKVVQTGPGAGTVEGLGPMAQMGIDTLVNVETVIFQNALRQPITSLSLFVSDNAGTSGVPTSINGSVGDDVINLPVRHPAATVSNFITINGGPGNDTITGHAGGNNITGGLGNDIIDGGAGIDTVNFSVVAASGPLRTVAGTGAEAGQTFIERTGTDGNERLFTITPNVGIDATISAQGAAADAGLGTDTLTNVESLSFSLQGSSASTIAGTLLASFNQATGVLTFTSASVIGTAGTDSLDASSLGLPDTAFVSVTGNAGNDTLIGHAGNGQFDGGAGDDSIDGSAGNDTAIYRLTASITGTVQAVTGTGADFGSILYQRVDGAVRETLLKIVPASGATPMTVTGFGPAASVGTDTLVGIENITLSASNGATLASQGFAQIVSPSFVTGTVSADTIDLNTVPGAVANIGANGGLGDDVIIGTAGSNNLEGGAGDDSIDGGSGGDTALYRLTSPITGTVELVTGTGADAGSFLYQRVDGAVRETLLKIVPASGSTPMTVTGFGPAAFLGTDTLVGVETITLAASNGATLASQGFALNVSPSFVTGTIFADTIDLNTVPGAVANIGANGGLGDDTIIGTPGDNIIEGGAGNDSIVGGAATDTALFRLSSTVTGTVGMVTGVGDDTGSVLYQRVDGAVRETLLKISPATGTTPMTVTGFGPAAPLGTDSLVDVEWIQLLAPNGATLFTQYVLPNLTPNFAFGGIFADNIDLNTIPGAIVNISASGGLGDDTITGSAGNNIIEGGAGNDTIDGQAGNDTINGGVGDDVVDGGAGTGDGAQFNLTGASGPLRLVSGTGGEVGQNFIERVGSDGTERLFAITTTPGTGASIAALNNAAASGQGTDTVTNVESLFFNFSGTNAASVQAFLGLGLDQATGALLVNNASLNGGTNADVLDATPLGLPATSFLFLNGFAGNDTLVGHAGNGNFNGGAGDDSIDGGAGTDTAQYVLTAPITGSVVVAMGTGAEAGNALFQRVDGTVTETLLRITPASGSTPLTVTGLGPAAGLGTDILVGIETITLSASNGATLASQDFALNVSPSLVTGTIFADTIDLNTVPGAVANIGANGGLGDDTITGTSGDNMIEGGSGNDRIDGGGGFDIAAFTLLPGMSDTLRLEAGSGPNAGAIIVRQFNNDVAGDAVYKIFRTEPGSAIVEGLGPLAVMGVDTITGIESINIQSSTRGFLLRANLVITDNATSGVLPTRFEGSVGDDTIDISSLFPAPVLPTGTYIAGGPGNDLLIGHPGTDSFVSLTSDRFGDDTMIGGAGLDFATFIVETNGFFGVALGSGAELGQIFIERHLNGSIERVFRITPGISGTSTVTGLGSAASLGHGTDQLSSVETLTFNNFFNFQNISMVSMYFNPSSGKLQVTSTIQEGSNSADTIDLVQLGITDVLNSTVYGRGGDDRLIGNTGEDRINGDGGNDWLDGRLGNDFLNGGDGDDLLTGGAGNDNINGGAGNDVAVFTGNRSNYAISRDPTLPHLVISDLRSGSPDGFDIVSNDTEILRFADGDVSTANFGVSLLGTPGPDSFFGTIGNDTLDGVGGDDSLSGQGGDDRLIGGAGNDILVGGLGRDTLTGGGGNDQFVLDTSAGPSLSLTDVITDFSIGSDRLLLPSGTSFANLTITQGTGADSANTIIGASSGAMLAVLLNIEAAQITAASF